MSDEVVRTHWGNLVWEDYEKIPQNYKIINFKT